MRRGIALAAIGLTLTSSAYFAFKQGRAWSKRGWGAKSTEFESFVREIEVAVPREARVRVNAPRGRQATKYANLLNARLHPRIVVVEGPADWVVDLPDEEFDRSRASFRRAGP